MGFRVHGLGFIISGVQCFSVWVEGLEFRVWGLGFGVLVWGLRFRSQGLGFRVYGFQSLGLKI